ncbi:cytochrome P450 [Streptomyces hokutonensis]|uniref:cytochrome P450 n=1 Tax=Streptomyces hokutonensis TaxID=1306990 RepID=UPI0033C8A66B
MTTAAFEADPLDARTFEIGVPFAAFDALRQEDPVHWHEPDGDQAGYWSVTRHQDVVAVTRDARTFSSQVGGTTLEDITDPENVEARRTLIDTDGELHTQLRRTVSARFAPAAIQSDWTTFVERLVASTLDTVLKNTEFEAVDQLCSVVPITVLGELLGLPPQDRVTLMRLGDEMIASSDPDHAPRTAAIGGPDARFAGYPFSSPAGKDLWEYADLLRERRRHALGHDVFSLLMTGQIDGRALTAHELDNYFSLLVVAGNETTRMALSHALLAFAEYPEEFRRLRQDPSLLPTATEEVLRWATPLHYFRRTATRDVPLGGKRIGAGDKVVMWYASANRDPSVFPEPYRFDVGRNPNPHLAFGGGGKHFCLGNSLAKLEIATTLRLLAERVTAIELAGPAIRTRSNLTNGIKSLPVRVIHV